MEALAAAAAAAAALLQQRGRRMAEAGQGRISILWAALGPGSAGRREGRRQTWQRKFVVADVAKWMDSARESGGNVGVKVQVLEPGSLASNPSHIIAY